MPDLPPSHRPASRRGHNWDSKRSVRKLTGRPWRRLVEKIKLRDQYTCQACGRITTQGECDHRIPLSKAGTDADDNLQWLCVDCHKEKTIRESGGNPRVAIGTDGFPISARIAARDKPGSNWSR